ncbi:MAG: DNA gyrase subunit B [Caudoviricetes sp.]|nr:MAG: DNA gyrase subunit B [Caudoviricetes sp.]
MGDYNLDSIQKLNFFEAVRKYPGMYIGSKDSDGLHHLPKEFISNSIDEFLNGSCNLIETRLYKDGSLSITDNGRGIPIGNKEDSRTALELCFTEEHAGGKFLNDTGKSGYNTSGGMHGLGAKCVNALSDRLSVISCNNGKQEYIEFLNGEKVKHDIEDIPKFADRTHGLSVHFYPSSKYLEEIKFDAKRLKTMIQEFSFLCKGLKFSFWDENTQEEVTYLSENGLYDYLEYLNNGKEFLCKPFYFEEKEDTFGVEVAFGYNDSYTSTTKLYTNIIPQIKGTHLTGFKTAFTSTLNAFAREKKWLKEKDKNLQGGDFEEGQLLVINFRMIDPVFKGQNKEELSSSEGRTYVQKFSSSALKELFAANEKEIKKIVDKALEARKARDAAKKAREAVRANQKKKKDKALKFDSKLADCYSKDRSKCEIIITEGDSASGNLKLARNNEFQAVLPVRGKIINTRKATLGQIQKNAEIMSMIDAFGLEIDPKTMKVTYHPEELRYGKIIIMSDADVDGAHIKNLFYTFIWTFCPQLIIDGYVYAGVPPLFKVTTSKGYVYLKDEGALKEYKATHTGKIQVTRLKGLGEMDVNETEETLTDPNNRIIKKIIVEDIEEANKLFDDLMGPKVTPRKEYIKEHSQEATYVI